MRRNIWVGILISLPLVFVLGYNACVRLPQYSVLQVTSVGNPLSPVAKAATDTVFALCTVINRCHPEVPLSQCRSGIMNTFGIDYQLGLPVGSNNPYSKITQADTTSGITLDSAALDSCFSNTDSLNCSSPQVQGAYDAALPNPFSGVAQMIPIGQGSCPSVFRPPVPSPILVFVGFEAGHIGTFSADPVTGAMSSIGDLYEGPPGGLSGALDPTGNFLFAISTGNDTLNSYFSGGSTGALNPSPGTPFPASYGQNNVLVAPRGGHVYISLQTRAGSLPNLADGIQVYTYDSSTGAIISSIPGSPFLTGPGTFPDGTAFYPLGNYFYSADSGTDRISAARVDSSSGALNFSGISGAPFLASGGPHDMLMHPSGQFVYLSQTTQIGVLGYSVDAATGALASLPGFPVVVPGSTAYPYYPEMAMDPLGKYLFISDPIGSRIFVFAINSSNGALSPVSGSPYSLASQQPLGMSTDRLGKFLFVANHVLPAVSVYAIDPSSGALREVSGSPFAMSDASAYVLAR